MEEKIFALIKGRIGKTSLSDRTLMAEAARLAGRFKEEKDFTDEELTSAVNGLKVLEGQYSHDLAEAMAELRKQMDQERKKQAPQPAPAPEEKPGDKALLEKLDKLTAFMEEYQKAEAEKAAASKRSSLLNEVSQELSTKHGCADPLVLRVALQSVDYAKEREANVAAVKAVYEAELAKYVSEMGYTPITATTESYVEKTPEQVKEQQDAMLKAAKDKGLI